MFAASPEAAFTGSQPEPHNALERIMTTGINNWVAMEQPELGGVLLVDDGRGLMPVTDLPYGAENLDDELSLWATPVTDMRPGRGPFAVTIGGDDDDVLYFRTAHAASTFAASNIDAPVTLEFVGDTADDFAA